MNIINIFFSCYFLYLYFNSHTYQTTTKNYYLTLYKDIAIEEYMLLDDIESKENLREYCSSIAKFFEIKMPSNDIDLFHFINEFRLKRNVSIFTLDKKIPSFIIEGSTEFLLSIGNIIKLSNIKYVIKLNIDDDFSEIKKNKDFMDILLKPFFNKIAIFRQRNTKYIMVYEDFDVDLNSYHSVQLRGNFENENVILKND